MKQAAHGWVKLQHTSDWQPIPWRKAWRRWWDRTCDEVLALTPVEAAEMRALGHRLAEQMMRGVDLKAAMMITAEDAEDAENADEKELRSVSAGERRSPIG